MLLHPRRNAIGHTRSGTTSHSHRGDVLSTSSMPSGGPMLSLTQLAVASFICDPSYLPEISAR